MATKLRLMVYQLNYYEPSMLRNVSGNDAGTMSKYNWQKFFDTIDLDDNSKLQASKIVQVLCGVLCTDDVLMSAWIDRADSDIDYGAIYFEEFH
jgi:hypothetical protein